MSMKFRWLLPLVAVLAVQLPGQIRDFKPDKQITFKEFDKDPLELNVFLPEGWKASDKRAAIVFFFGGGWVGGTPSQFFPQARYLSSRGMVAVSAQYRTRGSHGITPAECVADGKSAVRWMRAHADELGIDPDRLAAGGGSAGGHVGAATGVLDGMDEKGEDMSTSSKPNALVLFNPATDTSRLKERLGELAMKISPLHAVSKDDPPALLLHGKNDTTVPYETAEAFCEAMTKVGNRCEVVGYEGRPHGFFNYTRSRIAYTSTVWEMDRFLTSLGYMEGPPTVGSPGDPTW